MCPQHLACRAEPDHRSQIGFVITRCTAARGRAIASFPPFRRPVTATSVGQPRCQLDALQDAVAVQSEPALAMQHVEDRIRQLPSMDAVGLQASLNHILWDAAEQFSPCQPRADQRVHAQPQYKATARHTWHLYARLIRRRGTPPSLVHGVSGVS